MGGLLSRLKRGLSKTTKVMGLGLFFQGRTLDEEFIEDLEERLLVADMGPTYVGQLIDTITEKYEDGSLKDSKEVQAWLHSELLSSLALPPRASQESAEKPAVWFFLGVNGVGKTTSLGKLAMRLNSNKFSLLLAAGDTFRAAAGEQLAMWAERTGSQIVRHKEGGDPSAVVYDASQLLG